MSAIACSAEGSGSAITGTALEALDCQVAVLAEDGEVVLANKAWRKLAGAGAKSAAVQSGSFGIGKGGLDARAALFWLFVGIPLAWGVWKTLESAAKIL